jgi:signal transduction histidine kinase
MNDSLPQPAALAATRLRGGWLAAARVGWLAVALLTLAVFVANLPAEYAGLKAVCAGAGCAPDDLTPERVAEIQALGLSVEFFAAVFLGAEVLFVAIWFAIGAAIFWRKSDDRAALFVALFLVTFSTAIFLPAAAGRAAGTLAWWPIAVVMVVGSTCFHLFFLLFPDGRFVPAWTRALAPVLLLLHVLALLAPGAPFVRWVNPFRLAPFVTLLVIGVGAQIYRYRRVSGPEQRQQTRLVVFSAIGAVAAVTGAQAVPALLQANGVLVLLSAILITYLALLLIPLAIGVAILRYQLWDIRVLVSRTLVYGALTSCVVGIYVAVVGGLGLLFHARGNALISLAATGLIAVLFQPLRARLQRGVDRLVYGERHDPYVVLSRLGQRLEANLAPDAVLPTIVETVREALKLPYVAIALRPDQRPTTKDQAPVSEQSTWSSVLGPWSSDPLEVVVSSGELVVAAETGHPPDKVTRWQGDSVTGAISDDRVTVSPPQLVALSLVYQGETIGELRLAPRPGETGFGPADRRLLEDLAIQAGAAAHAVRLTADLRRLFADLQQSREQLIGAREEERRRIRRDLHDGVGPTLASLAQRIDTARRLVPRDPDAAMAMLADLRGQVKTTIADIRRLVYALRPPVLDELGLASAIRAHVVRHNQAGGACIALDAPAELPPLPAAVEVAAYRIALEALTNVDRHSGAGQCVVRLAVEDGMWLRVEVEDDGAGFADGASVGVGIASMRERATELGGEFRIAAVPGGGTSVRARLPL